VVRDIHTSVPLAICRYEQQLQDKSKTSGCPWAGAGKADRSDPYFRLCSADRASCDSRKIRLKQVPSFTVALLTPPEPGGHLVNRTE